MTPAAFDFRSPPPGELERLTAGWLNQAARLAAGAWAASLPFPADLKPGPVEAATAAAGLAALPDSTVGFPVTTPDGDDGTVLLAFPRPLLLVLLAGLFGDVPAVPPADREPTELEASLIGFLVRELFLVPLEKAWPGGDPLRLSAGPATPPHVAFRVPGGDLVLSAALTAVTPVGEHPVRLLVPRTGRWEGLAHPPAAARAVAAADPEHLAALVREMPVDLSVVLGTAEVSMADVARLRAGDLVVLGQKVTEPLDGLVAGTKKFRVWPGVVGTRAAVQIHAAEA